MTRFIPVNYLNKQYPLNIRCNIKEIAGHFGKSSIEINGEYSLHTEYSYNGKQGISQLAKGFPVIGSSEKSGIPQLWKSCDWAKEFACFIQALTVDKIAPKVIEVHPPFNDYCHTINDFLERYTVFEDLISKALPNTEIAIENRCGSVYSGGSFLISEMSSIIELLKNISSNQLKLKLVIDYPQLLTAEGCITSACFNVERFNAFMQKHSCLQPYKHLILGIHIWGKRKSSSGRVVPHVGDLNNLFCELSKQKNDFLELIAEFYNDDIPRYFVPEVNSKKEDLESIVMDFIDVGAVFDQQNM
ncbi:MAG: hypothetical protein VB064_01270 [Oscillospiraceae bacterium]|nr:hypothetical protein [Oscillospiraceae bacterium]